MTSLHDQQSCTVSCSSSAPSLNRSCFCRTLDQALLLQSLAQHKLQQDLLISHPFLFAHTAVFIAPDDYRRMQAVIEAMEALVQTPLYRSAVSARGGELLLDRGTSGVFMGYDFHLSATGPQLIEINTNAGGGFLNAALIGAQKACCAPMTNAAPKQTGQMEQEFVAMFFAEWRQQKKDTPLRTLAIVDDQPQQQFLYPEFQLARELFLQAGIEAYIVDAADLQLRSGHLFYKDHMIQMVYNRLTDFYLSAPQHQALKQAFADEMIVMTPDPFHYALYADKRNLTLSSDAAFLQAAGLADTQRQILCEGIPRTLVVNEENAGNLWQERRDYFFKPATGFGSRAAYRGDKLTKRVWQNIVESDYVAQRLVTPTQRFVLVDDQQTPLKLDLRAYVYRGRIQLLAARLYQGQTTNLRTRGGGFAPVFVARQDVT